MVNERVWRASGDVFRVWGLEACMGTGVEKECGLWGRGDERVCKVDGCGSVGAW